MTSRYRKVSTRIWNDEKFRTLSDDAKLAFFFVLTHPHMTALGAMRATVAGLAAELGWVPERLSEAFRKAIQNGALSIDETACCVALPNFLKHNPPASPNVVCAWGKAYDDIPECDLKTRSIQHARDAVEGMSEGFQEAFNRLPEGFRKSMLIQEHEHELELELEQKKRDSASPRSFVSSKTKEPINLETKKPSENHTHEDDALANRMFETIRAFAPSTKRSRNWADAVRMMRELDKHSHDEIWAMFEFVQNDNFWSTVILSPYKLRAKWPQLEALRNRGSNAKTRSPKPDNLAAKVYTGTADSDIPWLN